jgi:hypothetical protein
MILSIIVFFAVTSGFVGAYFWIAPNKTDQRLHAFTREDTRSQGLPTSSRHLRNCRRQTGTGNRRLCA